MKKLTLVILAAALAVSAAHAGWWRTYGGTDSDRGHCVQITSDGNYIISGVTWSFDYGSTWLLKLDTTGDTLWSRLYDGGMSWYHWVEETSDGGLVTNGLLRTSAQGDSIWAYDYGIRSYCVQETKDGGYILVGNYGYEQPLALLKTNQQGELQWEKSYKIDGWDFTEGYFVRQTNDEGYIVTGVVWDSVFLKTHSYPKSPSLLLLKTDNLGDTQWVSIPGVAGIGKCVRQTDDGEYVVAGSFGWLKADSLGDTLWFRSYEEINHVQLTMDGGYILTGGTNDLSLIKTDSEGEIEWSRTYGGSNTDKGNCVQQTGDGGYIVVGNTSSFGAGDEDIYLLRTDSLGYLGVKENNSIEKLSNWRLLTSVGPQISLQYLDFTQGFHADIYDVSGSRVDAITTKAKSGILTWGNTYPPGVYFIQIQNGKNKQSAKVVLVK